MDNGSHNSEYVIGSMDRKGRLMSFWPSKILFPICIFIFCTGFTLPSPRELRQEIRQELQKIKEMTPTAKRRAQWKARYEQAVEALKKAETQSAERYAPKLWQDALNLLSKAKEYAKKKSYLKAAYLAKKAKEAAESASTKAEEARRKAQASAKQNIEGLKKQIEILKKRASQGNQALKEKMDQLMLGLRDLVHALELEQFEQVKKGARELDERIRRLLEGSSSD